MGDYAAVGFDLDGTLFDHRGAATDAVAALTRQLGAAPEPNAIELWIDIEDRFYEEWRAGRLSFAEQRQARMRTFLPAIGVSVPPATRDLDGIFDQYFADYESGWRAFPDAVELIKKLRDGGVAVGVLTNGTREQQLKKLAAIGLADAFHVVCISEDIGFQKPDVRAFETLAFRNPTCERLKPSLAASVGPQVKLCSSAITPATILLAHEPRECGRA
ncbi:HAD family hydrolase [Lacisediminihabitans sp. G11-30]|uniref:HAD family hydrolase n=1 Tax=Lacisediminihabitans changchengi TaxID=2787634 RepID=A0A934SPR9_9MICO|nr:HAD family hydrolase [Lacisediminihabitans changchengi]MBK4348987.1 HAD family hydrolase [Lacisediminihabitans changchengi]